MSFYTGVVPADGLSAQAGINWSPHQQTRTNPQSPTSVRATSNSSNYAAPVTPAQAYARSVVSGQPVLQYTIERQQPEQTSGQQPGPNLTSPISASASTRGQSYAQRLYASSLGKQPQVQTPLEPRSWQPSSSESGESSDNRLPAGPRPPYGARASLMLNTSQINALQTVSALDFYHSSVSKFDLQSPVPDRGTNSQVARRPPSATDSASNISVPIQAPHGLQAPSRRGPVPMELSDGPPPSPASDPRRSSQAGLHSRSPPSTMDVMPGSSPSSDIPLRPESMNNAIASPVPSEPPPSELSPYSEDYVAAITSNPESATQRGDPLPASIQTENLGVGGSEEVPLYSLIDDEPPPPDFDESQSMCSMTRASAHHAEAPLVLAPPVVPSPAPHESDTVSGAVPSTGADTPSFVGIPRTLSPEPLSGSPRTSLAMPEVASYPIEKAPEDVKERSYGYSAEDSMPKFSEKSSSYPSMEASSSSRTLSEQVPSYGQPRYNTAPQDIPHPPFFPAVSPRDESSAKAFSTVPLPVLPPIRPVASTPAPITAPAPPPTSFPSSRKASAVNPVVVRPATSLPLRPGSSRLPSSPPPPRVMAAPTFPPSSAGAPPFIAASAGTTSQMYRAASSSPLPSPSLSQLSRGPPVLSTSSADTRPAGFRPQLSPDVSPTLQGQAPYQSPRESFQRPVEFRPQLSPDISPTLQGQAPYQSPRESFQRPVEFRPQLTPDVSPTLQGQSPYQSPRENFQRPVEFRPQLSPTVSPTPQGYAYTHTQAPYQSPRQSFQSQASPPPPPQHARANTSPPQSVQSSRGLGTNIATGLAGGVLGLLGGAVLAETLGGGDIVNDITGSMDGMTFGNPADGLFDPNMGAGDMIGSGFDSTANFQGDQPFSGDSFGQTYDMSDQTMGNGVDPSQFQGQSSMQPGPYFVSEQTQQIDITQTSDVSQSQQQPGNQSNQSNGTHYLHDAGLLLQAAYKMYNTPHQSGTAQGFQGSQTTAPLQQTPAFTMSGTSNSGRPPNSLPIGYAQTSPSISFHGTFFDHFTT
ncbi:hypothetical protein BDR05DRAFT_144738 [Suillus weaverae]|nr:hypothetical protein BDR05DRAFT_144738 [Suillus weaverae]